MRRLADLWSRLFAITSRDHRERSASKFANQPQGYFVSQNTPALTGKARHERVRQAPPVMAGALNRYPLLAPALAILLLLTPACRIHKKTSHAKAAEDDGQSVSVINVGDPRAAVQLTRGFHGLEHDSWRWTMKNFTATLRPPANAANAGATLQLKFTIPQVMFDRVGDMRVEARLNGLDLGSQTYTQPGDYIYTRDVPATALSADAVSIDFHVDKGLPPSDQDTRELALIVTTIGLLPK